ncbi:CRISPR-associated protein [Carbonactinospora thermoautotrophica]|uniref:CRISPR-associated protein n=1 Tax=Carbonactinospora thermoautotrophica TaxID=1469144 RepID=A0A132MYE8_9ACTN|nr:CRISPR-associated protein [Carbonactinospora thermoautotrophica]
MTIPRFVDIHLLQTIPYANLNRDDLGSPKSVVYGGVTRTRVSSQCWKRATREALDAQLPDRAVRTRRVVIEVAERLREDGWPDDLADYAARQLLTAAGAQRAKSKKKDGDDDGGLALEENGYTSVLLFLPASALDDLAALARRERAELERTHASGKNGKSPFTQEEVRALLTGRTGTIALFGRMLAELPGGKVDGAVQVAHAFTTHATDTEVDFFTAVDDTLPPEETGSGHMNSAEFSAGVFYRYATVDVVNLIDNLDGDVDIARQLVERFLAAFATAMPTGKRTATAPHTLPDLAYIAVRADRPVSLAAAFERPVRAGWDAGGWAEPSRRQLADYANVLHQMWGTGGLVQHAYVSVDPKPLDGLGDKTGSFPALVTAAVDAVFTGRG